MDDKRSPAGLKHRDHRVRLAELRFVAANVTDPEVLWERLRPLLADAHSTVRDAAAQALGDRVVGSDAIAQHFVEDLDGAAATSRELCAVLVGVRWAAAVATTTEGSIWDLFRQRCALLTASDDLDVRFHAISALRRLEPLSDEVARRLLPLIGASDDDVTVLAIELVVSSDLAEVVPALLELRRHARPGVQRAANLGLGRLAAVVPLAVVPGALEQVVAALEKIAKGLPFGLEACEVLGGIDTPSARGSLRRLSGSWFLHRLLRVAAVAALASSGDPDALASFTKLLRHRRRDARGYAIELVARHHLVGFRELLLAIARSARDYHSDTAVVALAGLGEAATTFEGLASDPRPEVRLEVARALRSLAPDSEALTLLVTSDPDEDVREMARTGRE